jgi:cell division protein FtsB
VSARVHAHSKKSKSTSKPFRPAREAPALSTPARRPARTKATKAAKAPDSRASKGPNAAVRPKAPARPRVPEVGKASLRAKISKPSKLPKFPKGPKAPIRAKAPTQAKAPAGPEAPARAGAGKATRLARSLGSIKPVSTIRSIRVPARTKVSRASKSTTGTGPSRGSRSPKVLLASLRASARRPSASAGAAGTTTAGTDEPVRQVKLEGKSVTGNKGKTKRQPVSALTRRNRIPVVVAGVFALVVLAVGFPAATLISQHRQQAANSAELVRLRHENGLLAEQQRAFNSKTEITRIARQDYQLVLPGQVLYEVLPPSGATRTAITASGGTESGGTESGDPGDQPLVSPSHAPDMSPDPGLPQAITQPAGEATGRTGSDLARGASQGPTSYWDRVANTLEFWR